MGTTAGQHVGLCDIETLFRTLAGARPTLRIAIDECETLLSSDDKRKASADRHPLKRIGDACEVAKTAAFLLSEDSGFITGQVLQIDGGISSLKML